VLCQGLKSKLSWGPGAVFGSLVSVGTCVRDPDHLIVRVAHLVANTLPAGDD